MRGQSSSRDLSVLEGMGQRQVEPLRRDVRWSVGRAHVHAFFGTFRLLLFVEALKFEIKDTLLFDRAHS